MSRRGVSAERTRDEFRRFHVVKGSHPQLTPFGNCDDLDRDVYCVLGIPVDAVDMGRAVRQIKDAARARQRFLISTPNLNFVVNSRFDAGLRDSVLESDLCTADGKPIVWIGRWMGMTIQDRVAGSDILDSLQKDRAFAPSLKLFLFGGADGVAEIAAKRINTTSTALRCVGTLQPGYGSVEQMSSDATIEAINASEADFLVVSLGAAKGQAWLRRNNARLTVPVRSHFGAAINFQAGTVNRAPLVLQKLGLEWLWRIKEEPYLWRRYAHDGSVLLKLLVSRILPLLIESRRQRHKLKDLNSLSGSHASIGDGVVLTFKGAAIAANVGDAIKLFKQAVNFERPITIDLAAVSAIDARFIGALLMLRKIVLGQGGRLNFTPVSPYLARMFRLHGVEYLLTPDKGSS